jgi:hypothetical protein
MRDKPNDTEPHHNQSTSKVTKPLSDPNAIFVDNTLSDSNSAPELRRTSSKAKAYSRKPCVTAWIKTLPLPLDFEPNLSLHKTKPNQNTRDNVIKGECDTEDVDMDTTIVAEKTEHPNATNSASLHLQAPAAVQPTVDLSLPPPGVPPPDSTTAAVTTPAGMPSDAAPAPTSPSNAITDSKVTDNAVVTQQSQIPLVNNTNQVDQAVDSLLGATGGIQPTLDG